MKISLPKIHPSTGTDYSVPLYVSTSGRKFYPIGGGADDGADDGSEGGESGGEQHVEEFTPITSQEEFEQRLGKRLGRERAKYAGFDDFKAKAEQFDTLEAASRTDQERAVAEARAEGRAEAVGESTPRVVRAEFKAAAKGVLTSEQLTALIEDLDLSKYVTESGDADEEKVAKKISAFAPANNGSTKHQTRDLGQGKRESSKTTGVGAGADLFASTRNKTT